MPSGTVRSTFIITLGAVLVTVSAGVLASYAIVRMRFRGRVLLYFLLVSTMIVPLQLILIPLLPWTRQLGLLGGQWRPFVATATAVGSRARWPNRGRRCTRLHSTAETPPAVTRRWTTGRLCARCVNVTLVRPRCRVGGGWHQCTRP